MPNTSMIHKETNYSSIVAKNKRHFRIRTKDVGRKGFLKLRVAFPKKKGKSLIHGRKSVIISKMYPRNYVQ